MSRWVDVPDHRAEPDDDGTCRVCRGVVRTWPDGRFPIHAEPRPLRMEVYDVNARLDYLRGQIEAESISYGEIAELQDLAEHIDLSDVVLLQWADVPEGEVLTGHDCAYCGATLTPGVERVCDEQGGDPAGTWHCSEGADEDRDNLSESELRLLDGNR